jgi:hypothetical protein
MRRALYCAIVVALASQIGCEHADDKRHVPVKVQESIMVKTDVVGLQRLVNLPYAPTSVKWSTTRLPGRDDWSLDAVMQFKAEEIKGLLETAERLHAGTPTVPRRIFESSFPEAARGDFASALAEKSDRIRVDATRITAALFVAPDKSPAIHGDALVLERYNIVYLSLYTM